MKKNKIKAAFLGWGLHDGGAETNTIHIAHYLNNHNVQTELILFKKINDHCQQYKSKLKRIKIRYILNRKKIDNPIIFFHFLVGLIKIVVRGKYDVFLPIVEGWPAFFCAFFALMLGKKNISIFGENIFADGENKNILEKNIYYLHHYFSSIFSSKIIVVSQGLKKALVDKFNINSKKVIVIYNGVDEKVISKEKNFPLPKEYRPFFSKNLVVIILGRLASNKGHFHLIRSFSYLKKYPKIKLFIIGKGKEENKLKELVKNLELQNKIIFYGFEKKNPYKFLSRSKLFVFPSLYEGFGNVLLEAMICGLPVIVSDCDYGPREILDDDKFFRSRVKKIVYKQWGVLIPSFLGMKEKEAIPLEKELAKLIVKMIKDKKKITAYRKKGRERVSYFSLERMNEGYLKAIRNTLL